MSDKFSWITSIVKNASFFALMVAIIFDAYSIKENTENLEKSNTQMEIKNINDQGNLGLKSSLEDIVKKRIDISGAKLNNRFLTGIKISHVHGQSVDWTGSLMQHSTISHADLIQSDFSKADLTGATLYCFNNTDEYCNGKKKIVNVKLEPHRVDPFEDEKPSIVGEEDGSFGVLFRGANLKDSIMSHGGFADDDFSNADLSGAKLRHSDFSYAIFDNAVLDNADISGSNFQNTRGLTQEMVNRSCYIPHIEPKLPSGFNFPSKNCFDRSKLD